MWLQDQLQEWSLYFIPPTFISEFPPGRPTGSLEEQSLNKIDEVGDFPGGPVVKNPPTDAGDTGSIPGLGRSHVPQDSLVCVPRLLKPTCLEPTCLDLQQERPLQ